MMLLNTILGGADAHRLGLVDEVCEPGATLARAREIAQLIATGPAQAYAVIKDIYRVPAANLADALDCEITMQPALLCSPDYEQAVSAFAAGRHARPSASD